MIGVHGSGLINMLWMPEKATVIELFPLEFFNRDYELPASVLGFNYTGIVSTV
jgi:capsular polysaccharide biosynthesis protein